MAKIKIKPLADRVVIEAQPAETKTAGGIIIPDTAQEKPQKGKVMAIGTGTKDEEMKLKVGDVVLYDSHSVFYDHHPVVVTNFENVVVILERKTNV